MGVAPEHVAVTQMHARDEEDGRLLGAGVLVDHRRQLKAVDLRHVDIHKDHGDVGVEQVRQGFPARRGRDEVLAQLTGGSLHN